MTECDQILIALDNVSTKKINTIAKKKDKYYSKNFTSVVLINCLSKKVRDFTHSFISDHTNIDNYYCLLLFCKTKLTI